MKFNAPLPKGWELTLCSEFCSGRNRTLDPAKAGDKEFILYSVPSHAAGKPERAKAADIGSNKQFVAAGDTLISKINPRLNRTWVVGEHPNDQVIASTEWIVFSKSAAFIPAFLAYFLQQRVVRDFLSHNASGVGGSLTRIRASIFEKVPLPLPPLAEQKRIVAKIEELFSELEAGEESLRLARRQLATYRQSLLKQAFQGHLTAQWREENPDNLESPDTLLARIQAARQSRYKVNLKKWESRSTAGNVPTQAKPRTPLQPTPLDFVVLSDLPLLPPGWTWAKMEDTCDIVRGGSPRPAGDPKFYNGDIPFLKVADLTRTDGPYVDHFTSTIKHAGLQKTRYVEPPVLLISNSGATLGVPRICRIATTFNDGVAAFLDLDPESHRYFYYFWTGKTETLRNIDQGAAQPNLNTDLLKTYPVPLCPLSEQHEIVRLLDEQFEAIERNEREIDAALKRSEALRQSILHRAFTGRLVPQDPADEPATQLLTRLQAEMQKGVATKRPPVKKGRARITTSGRHD